ncbi:hypothetical protein HanRHA438_Chr14g0651031 [Helianthus annuus]|uniref:Uncharacterized protein n=1 Tax=Helianthus annuus TaxID=4232 RepID=A0A9K3H877_HELAN|nr:hypothetical protein HanXRQr2_Chr14g0640651 [Helianthus annuus]KAJ0853422.1 hypothetical protein HanRHA438_Chr14g0651031 [Helianthus annuus]
MTLIKKTISFLLLIQNSCNSSFRGGLTMYFSFFNGRPNQFQAFSGHLLDQGRL